MIWPNKTSSPTEHVGPSPPPQKKPLSSRAGALAQPPRACAPFALLVAAFAGFAFVPPFPRRALCFVSQFQKSVGLRNTLRPSKSACSKTQTSVRIRRSVTSVQTTVRVSGRVVPLSTSELRAAVPASCSVFRSAGPGCRTHAALQEAATAFADEEFGEAQRLLKLVLRHNPDDGPALFMKQWVEKGPIKFVK